jgi:hypothetical protein
MIGVDWDSREPQTVEIPGARHGLHSDAQDRFRGGVYRAAKARGLKASITITGSHAAAIVRLQERVAWTTTPDLRVGIAVTKGGGVYCVRDEGQQVVNSRGVTSAKVVSRSSQRREDAEREMARLLAGLDKQAVR